MGTIRFDPPLPAWRMRAEQETSQGSLIKVQAAYDEPFWRADGLSGTGFGARRGGLGDLRQLAARTAPRA